MPPHWGFWHLGSWAGWESTFSTFGTHLEDDPLDEEIAFFRRVLSNWHTYAVLKRPTRERRLPRPSRPRVKATPSEARGPEGRPVPGRPVPSPSSSSPAPSSALSSPPPTPLPPAHGGRSASLRSKKIVNCRVGVYGLSYNAPKAIFSMSTSLNLTKRCVLSTSVYYIL